ncbi:MAG: hypothetical protein ACKO0N_00635, partial [Planctomycetota bacterium]
MLTLAERMFSQKVGTGAAVSFVPIAERRTGLSLPPAASAVPLRKKVAPCRSGKKYSRLLEIIRGPPSRQRPVRT